MRPRPRAVENLTARNAFRAAGNASMRPRPRAVENGTARAAVVAACEELQCGHGPCRGELSHRRYRSRTQQPSMRPRPEPWRTPARRARESSVLQCGHGLRAVENGEVPWPDGESAAFNAATASCRGEPVRSREAATTARASMRPRPSCRGEPARIDYWRSEELALQCGHGPRGRGEPEVCWTTASPTTASMRPRPSWPWRTSIICSIYRLVGTLQCGHGPRAVENADLAVCGRYESEHLQCGHGPRAVENDECNANIICSGDCFNAATASCRGEPCSPSFCGAAQAPSMRPRPSCRGEP